MGCVTNGTEARAAPPPSRGRGAVPALSLRHVSRRRDGIFRGLPATRIRGYRRRGRGPVAWPVGRRTRAACRAWRSWPGPGAPARRSMPPGATHAHRPPRAALAGFRRGGPRGVCGRLAMSGMGVCPGSAAGRAGVAPTGRARCRAVRGRRGCRQYRHGCRPSAVHLHAAVRAWRAQCSTRYTISIRYVSGHRGASITPIFILGRRGTRAVINHTDTPESQRGTVNRN